MEIKTVTIYTRHAPWCPWCDAAKKLLQIRNLAYKEFVLYEDLTKQEYIEQFFAGEKEKPTVPLIFINDRRIGGYDDLKLWMAEYEKETTQ